MGHSIVLAVAIALAVLGAFKWAGWSLLTWNRMRNWRKLARDAEKVVTSFRNRIYEQSLRIFELWKDVRKERDAREAVENELALCQDHLQHYQDVVRMQDKDVAIGIVFADSGERLSYSGYVEILRQKIDQLKDEVVVKCHALNKEQIKSAGLERKLASVKAELLKMQEELQSTMEFNSITAGAGSAFAQGCEGYDPKKQVEGEVPQMDTNEKITNDTNAGEDKGKDWIQGQARNDKAANLVDPDHPECGDRCASAGGQ